MSTIITLREESLPDACWVFKHSTARPVSARAADEVQAMDSDLPVFDVRAMEERSAGKWRVFSKLGHGPSRGGEFVHVTPSTRTRGGSTQQ